MFTWELMLWASEVSILWIKGDLSSTFKSLSEPYNPKKMPYVQIPIRNGLQNNRQISIIVSKISLPSNWTNLPHIVHAIKRHEHAREPTMTVNGQLFSKSSHVGCLRLWSSNSTLNSHKFLFLLTPWPYFHLFYNIRLWHLPTSHNKAFVA